MRKITAAIVLFLAMVCFTSHTADAAGVRILVGGKDITDKSESRIVEDRILVPIRFVSEALGKSVEYIEGTREVVIRDMQSTVTLKIGSRLIERSDGVFLLTDVPAQAYRERTYVPIRAVAEAFDLSVRYSDPEKTVRIENGEQNPEDAYAVDGFAPEIREDATFTVRAGGNLASRIDSTSLYVVDPVTKKGWINDHQKGLSVHYLPWDVKSFKVLLVASFDANGRIVAGRGLKVKTDITPSVSIGGVEDGGTYTDVVSVEPKLNFVAETASFTVMDTQTGEVQTFDKKDPYAPWQFSLKGGETKAVRLHMTVKDRAGNNYISQPVSFTLSTPRKLSLTGVKEGQKILRSTVINVSRNFDVRSTRYYLGTPGGEILLEEKPYGSHLFSPKAEYSGLYTLRAEVELPDGETMSTDPVQVELVPGARLLLMGIGPKAVLNEKTSLQYDANTEVTAVRYQFTGAKSFAVPGVLGGKTEFTPTAAQNGSYQVRVEADTPQGKLQSEAVEVTIHVGELYKARAVVAKEDFIKTFAPMAVRAFERTGMAASIQLAQAILETGWGQFVPVDKYDGKLSKNLFGIKGRGSNGSVISNTTEEYNGVRYRIDDAFRAYRTLEESWLDHKTLLLEKERYGIFRDVMFDPYRGAWAIRRAGYATDSEYPGKLIKIINDNDLRAYDEVSF